MWALYPSAAVSTVRPPCVHNVGLKESRCFDVIFIIPGPLSLPILMISFLAASIMCSDGYHNKLLESLVSRRIFWVLL